MSLTLEQLSKKTKLSVSTIRVYASQKNLGKKVGNKRVFSEADVERLLKGSNKRATKKAKASSKSPAKEVSKKAAKKQPLERIAPKAATPENNASVTRSQKQSIWFRLFGGGNKKSKVSLMNAKTTK